MVDTTRLGLPQIAGEQALKHITHNEALTALDGVVQLVSESLGSSTPPGGPVEGTVYGIGASATGDWSGHDGALGQFTSGGWRFMTPGEGWRVWDKAIGTIHIHISGAWVPIGQALSGLHNVALLGVNATADTTNRFAVRSNAALFNALNIAGGGTGDMRLTLNKESASDTGGIVFQDAFSGRAEIGLAGNDDFVFKVSADGSSWSNALTLEAGQGMVTFGSVYGSAPTFPTIAGGVLTIGSSYVIPAPESGTVDSIDTISGGFDGALLLLSGTSGNAITINKGTGNIQVQSSRLLDEVADTLLLVKRGSDWFEISFTSAV